MADNLIGATTAIFTVSLSVTVAEPVDVAWSTKDGTAKAGTDYEAANGVLTFQPGELNKQIEVTVYGANAGATGDKKFYIKLNPPTNAVLVNSLIDCTITVTDESGVPVTSIVVAQGKRGLKGDPGMSAYEHAVLMGYQGTIEEWMEDQASAARAAARAEDAIVTVEAAASRAEAAAASAAFAGKIYPTPEAGVDPITGAPNGYFYNVRSTSGDSFIDEYQNVNGVPVSTGKTYPSGAKVAGLMGNVASIEDAIIDPNTGDAVALKLIDASGKSQQLINNAILGATYYSELEGFSITATDNSAAWTTLQAKMNAGDSLVFKNGTYVFLSPFIIAKNINISGTALPENAGTIFNFTNSTNGIIRTVRGGDLSGIRITGKQTSTVFDFANSVFGTVGLWDKYDDTAKAGYVNTRNIHISGFDTGRVNATGGSEIWAGAYRETYDTYIKANRCGCVFLNGATHDKYYGGTISANSMIGIWAEAPRVQYNNISFIGTTIEGNGKVDSAVGYTDIDYRTNVSIFVGKNTAVNLIGSYCERMMSYAKDGGVLNKIGSYEHYNSLNFANDATIDMQGASVGTQSKLVIIPKARALWQTMIRGTLAPLDDPDGITIRSTVNSTDGYALRSKPIYIKQNLKNSDIRRIKVSFSYRFKSGYTANPDLLISPRMNLYSKTAGRLDAVPQATFPMDMLKGRADNKEYAFEYYYQPRVGSTALDDSGIFDYIMLNFVIMNGANALPQFSSNNLECDIYNVQVSIYTHKPTQFTYTLQSGDTTSRPLLNTTDKGYRYYDTTLNNVFTWTGATWDAEVLSNDVIAGSTTSTSLSSISNSINTLGKYRGRTVLNETNNKFYIAIGSSTSSAWRATDGSGDIVPA